MNYSNKAKSNSVTAWDIFFPEGVTARRPDLSPEQSWRCWGQNVAAVEGPRQEADSTPSNTLKRHTALRSNIPHLKTMASLQAVRLSAPKWTSLEGSRVCPPSWLCPSVTPTQEESHSVTRQWTWQGSDRDVKELGHNQRRAFQGAGEEMQINASTSNYICGECWSWTLRTVRTKCLHCDWAPCWQWAGVHMPDQ